MTRRLRISRSVQLPDPFTVARYRRAPELGPRVLFLSGGSALRELSRTLKRYTHNSIHLITSFDSGGSSARLREAFDMLSIGDLRNRLMALADESARGSPELYELFSFRFGKDADPIELGRRLERMVKGTHPLVEQVPEPMQRIVRTHLRFFAEKMPPSFDLRGASIGNLVLAGGYLANDRDVDSVIFLFSKLVEVRGVVRPISHADRDLAAVLENDRTIVGQHLLTGKEVAPLDVPIRDLYLVSARSDSTPQAAQISSTAAALIGQADLLCYPMGSFYSSIVANLLPAGVGRAICAAECPKVYVANMGEDPEQVGMSTAGAVAKLLHFVRRDAGDEVPVERILNFILVDSQGGDYRSPSERHELQALGIDVIDAPLVSEPSAPRVDPQRLTEILLSMS